MLHRIHVLASILSALALPVLSASAAEPLAIEDAWIRATPPGVRTAAAYLTIVNTGPTDRLLGGRTPAAERVEVHTHVADGGMSRMVRLEALPLPTGETVRLEPGGAHLMLLDIVGPLAPGATVPVSVTFESAGTYDIEVPVVDARASAPPPHHLH